jgi:hypothetical protein
VVRERASHAAGLDGLHTAIPNHVGTEGDGAAPTGTEETDKVDKDAPRSGGVLTNPIGIVVALVVVIACGFMVIRASDRGDGKILVEGAPPAGSSETAAPAKPAGPENLFNKAGDNFTSILTGRLTEGLKTSDPEELAQYFKENGVTYPVTFAPVRAELKGGAISQHGQTRMAHVFFAKGDATIYLFEVPLDVVRRKNIVEISDEVLKQLEAGNTLWEQPGSNTLAMFKKGDLICVIVANLWKEELVPIISTK